MMLQGEIESDVCELQAAKIQKAEDVGRTAWQKGATQEGNIKVLIAINASLYRE